MRYRSETFGQYGYGAGLPPHFGIGVLLGTPIAVASGLAAALAGAGGGESVSIPKVERAAASRPKENELLAVPVNKLYDRGTTVMMSANLLRERIGGGRIPRRAAQRTIQ